MCQQIIKLGADDVINEIDEVFIVWDSDLLPVKSWPLVDEKKVKFALFTEDEIFGEKKRGRSVQKSKIQQTTNSLENLKEGDPIVHIDYGIGCFQGLKKINALDSKGEFISEIVSTFGLLTTIHGLVSLNKKEIVPNAVSMYIMSGYWYTLSTCFANPAVTIART